MRLPTFVLVGIVLLSGTPASAEVGLAGCVPDTQFASWQSIQANVESLQHENTVLRDRLTELEAAAFSPSASEPTGCNTCARAACQTCCSQGGFGAGGGVYFLKPHWENNPAYGIFVGSAISGESYSQFDFDWGAKAAWDVWLEYVGAGGGGLRTRYWQFDHGVSQQSLFALGVNEAVVFPRPLGLPKADFGSATFRFESGLETQVVDFEALQRLRRGAWSWEFSGGVRWASLDQRYRGEVTGGAQTQFLTFGHDFDGIGPLLAIEGRRGLFGSGLSLFAKTRGALLFGDADATGAEGRITENFGVVVDSTASASRWDTIPVLELELGASYTKPVGAMMTFLEAAFVGNTWFGAGNASYSGPLEAGAPVLISERPVFGTSNNDNLGLIGGRFTAGLTY